MPTAAPHAVSGKGAMLGKKQHTGSAGKAPARKPAVVKGPFARMQLAKKQMGSDVKVVTPEDRRKDHSGEHQSSKARKALPMAGAGVSRGSGSPAKRTKKTTPFSLFFKNNLERVKAEHPDLVPLEQMHRLNDEWSELPMDEKRRYEEQAKALEARIQAEARARADAKAATMAAASSAENAKAGEVSKSKSRPTKPKVHTAPRKRPSEPSSATNQKRPRSQSTMDAPGQSIVSAFKVYREEHRQSVKERFPDLTKEARAAKLKEQYRSLDPESQRRYQRKADERNAALSSSASDAPGLSRAAGEIRSPEHHSTHQTESPAKATLPGMNVKSAAGTMPSTSSPKYGAKHAAKGTAITDFFRKSEKKPTADLKPLTAEQQAKIEKEKAKIRRKLMSKQEREAEKQRLKEEKAKERAAVKQQREEEKKRRREEEKRQRQAEVERRKPREDTDLTDSVPLPQFTLVSSRLPPEIFGDVVMLSEFIQTFSSAFASLPREKVSAKELEDAILQTNDNDTAHIELLTLAACFVVVAFEVDYGQDSCAVDTVLGLKLRDLPVNMHTASDVLRLYLVRTNYAAAGKDEDEVTVQERVDTVKVLETSELATLSPNQIIEVLRFLSNKAFSNSHFMDKVEDALERIPQIRKEQTELEREEAREKKAAEEAAKRAAKDDGDALKPVDADAALAALLFEKENSRSGRRITRHLEETPQEKTAREALEEIERKQHEAEEREERRSTLADEMITQRTCLRGRLFGFDRDWSQYRLLASLPGLVVQTRDGLLRVVPTLDEFEVLIAALNDRGIREASLKKALLENRDEIERQIKLSVKRGIPSANTREPILKQPEAIQESDSSGGASSICGVTDASPSAMVVDDSSKTHEHDAHQVDELHIDPAESARGQRGELSDTHSDEPSAHDDGRTTIESAASDAAASLERRAGSFSTDGIIPPPVHIPAPIHSHVDELMLSAVKVDVMAFYDKILEGGFGVPDRHAWMKAMEEAVTSVAIGKCLLDLEEHIELRFLQKPLGRQRESLDEELTETTQIVAWRQYANEATSPSKVSLLYELLYESIRWDKSAKSIKCKVCRKSTDEEELLLCDGCNQGFHTYCLKPKLFEIPQGDWFCKTCKPPVLSGRAAKRNALALLMDSAQDGENEGVESEESEDDYSDQNDDDSDDQDDNENDNTVDSLCSVCNEGGEVLCCDTCPLVYHLECIGLRRAPRGQWNCDACKNSQKRLKSSRSRSKKTRDRHLSDETVFSHDSRDGHKEDDIGFEDLDAAIATSLASKGDQRTAMSTCEDILKLLKRHEEAWPFLEPVDTDEISDYLDVVTTPMDLQTVREKLDKVEYLEPLSFCADVRLIFDNCKLYNQPDSEAGQAGLALEAYFEKLYKQRFSAWLKSQ